MSRRLVVAFALVAAACARGETPAATVALDDFGDTVRTGLKAGRVVSLNPVTTELAFALGAQDKLVGRTHWDLHPAAAAAVPDMGNGMGPNVEMIIGQKPDLVILYASEMNRAAVAQLRRAGIATLTYRTDHIADLARVTPVIASAMGVEAQGKVVVDSVRASLDAIAAMPVDSPRVTAFWFVWPEPLLTIGRGSYLDELLTLGGGTNVFGDLAQPSPQVSLEEVAKRDPYVILAGPNSAEQIRTSPQWRSVRAVREGRIRIVDTTIVGRPGVRMGEAARHIRAVLEGVKQP